MTNLYKDYFDSIEVDNSSKDNRRMLVVTLSDAAPQEFEYDCITALIKLTIDQSTNKENSQFGSYAESVEPD